MNAVRTLPAAAGVGALLLALLAAAGADVVPAGALVALFGNDYFLVAAIGGAGLLLAIPLLASGRAAKLRQLEMPTPERPTSASPAGAGFDAACRRWRLLVPVYARDERERLRSRLRTAAVEALRRRESCDRAAAIERVESESWSDDEVATALLSDDQLPIGFALRSLAAGEPPFGRAARRAAAEIVARDGSR